MGIHAPVLFPLRPIVDGACSCSGEQCPGAGKHPAVPWKELTRDDMKGVALDPEGIAKLGHSVGIKTGAGPVGSDVFVVDLDGPEGLENFIALGGFEGRTFTVATPRAEGGLHLYFQHPGFRVKNSVGKLATKIDIRGDGGMCVAPGSPHKSGGRYEVVDDSEPAEAPEWLLDWLWPHSAEDEEVKEYAGDVEGDAETEHRKALFKAYCQTAKVGTLGDRHMKLWPVVQHGAYDLSLPTETVLEIVAEEWNPRCKPPMAASELRVSVEGHARGAKNSSTRPQLEPMPLDVLEAARGRSTDLVVFKAPEASEDVDPSGIRWGGWDKPIPPPEYLLHGLIPEHKVVTWYAEGGSVKTWAAIHLATCVATGEPFLGAYPVKKGKALYLDYEDGPYEVSRRVRLLLRDGQDVKDLGYRYGGSTIDRVEFWKELAPIVEEHGVIFIVIDSLNAAMPASADENVGEFSAGLKLAGKFTDMGVTILFIHHANKSGGMRGSTTIRDQSDTVFRFEPVSEADGGIKRMRMVCDKPGPQKKPAPVNIQLSDDGLTTFEDEAHTAGRNANGAKDVRAAILLALDAEPQPTKHKLRDKVGARLDKVTPELEALVAEGRVVFIPPAGYQLDDDEKRTARVMACLGRPDEIFKSAARLAEAAYVPTHFVKTMERKGLVVGSGEGRLLGVMRNEKDQ